MKLLERDQAHEAYCRLRVQQIQTTTALQHHVHNGNHTKQSMPWDEVRLVVHQLVVINNNKTCKTTISRWKSAWTVKSLQHTSDTPKPQWHAKSVFFKLETAQYMHCTKSEHNVIIELACLRWQHSPRVCSSSSSPSSSFIHFQNIIKKADWVNQLWQKQSLLNCVTTSLW